MSDRNVRKPVVWLVLAVALSAYFLGVLSAVALPDLPMIGQEVLGRAAPTPAVAFVDEAPAPILPEQGMLLQATPTLGPPIDVVIKEAVATVVAAELTQIRHGTIPPDPRAVTPTVVVSMSQPDMAAKEEVANAVAEVPPCHKQGSVAWHADNIPGLYEPSVIGGDEECGMVAQTWTTFEGTERFIFFIPPGVTVWISNHKGGTGWFFNGSPEDVMKNLEEQAEQLLLRDGEMKTTIAVLPEQMFRLVVGIRLLPLSGVHP